MMASTSTLHGAGAGNKFDAIVVLGAGMKTDGRPGAALKRRVEQGVRLFKNGEAELLLFTGGRGPTIVLHERLRNPCAQAENSFQMLPRRKCSILSARESPR